MCVCDSGVVLCSTVQRAMSQQHSQYHGRHFSSKDMQGLVCKVDTGDSQPPDAPDVLVVYAAPTRRLTVTGTSVQFVRAMRP